MPLPRSPAPPPSTASVRPKVGRATGRKPTKRDARRPAGRTVADVHLSRRGALTAAAVAALHRLASPAAAQSYPAAGPIRVIVPFAAPRPVDILARIIVDPLAKQLGQSVIVENRGGAGGNIALDDSARSKSDGYTLHFTFNVFVVYP